MKNFDLYKKYWNIHKQVTIRFWDNLPNYVREVIAADIENTSKSLDYFSKAVGRETERLFKESFR